MEHNRESGDLDFDEDLFRVMVEQTKEYAIFALDTTNTIVTWNTGAERILQYTADEAIGQKGSIIFTPEDQEAGAHEHELRRATTGGQAQDERWHVRKDGSRFWASGILTALRRPDGSLGGFAKVIRDNTERKQAAEQLEALNRAMTARVAERTRQLQKLSSELISAEQRERQRIAEILHDDLQQVLFGLQMQLESLRLQAVSTGNAKLLAQIRESAKVAQDAVRITRTLAVDLVPPVLMAEDLIAILEWLATKTRDLHGLEVEIHASGQHRPYGDQLRILVFQVVRELLFNVVKHAGASKARITVSEHPDRLSLAIEDEGKGFDVSSVVGQRVTPQAFGLSNLRYRLQLIGGSIDIQSIPGNGTRVVIDIPVETPRTDPSDAPPLAPAS